MDSVQQQELEQYLELSALMDAAMADYFEWYHGMGYVYDPESDEAIREMTMQDFNAGYEDLHGYGACTGPQFSRRGEDVDDYHPDGRYGWRTTGMRDGAMIW